MEGGLSNLKVVGDALPMLVSHLHDMERLKVVRFTNKDTPVLDEDSPILKAALLLTHSTAPLPALGMQVLAPKGLGLREPAGFSVLH